METLESCCRRKVTDVLSRDDLTFGVLLQGVRQAIGLKLYAAAEDLGFGFQKLALLEAEGFRRMPGMDDVKKISIYYGVPYELLVFKLQQWDAARGAIAARNKAIADGVKAV